MNTKVLGQELTSITFEKDLHFGDYCLIDAITLVLREGPSPKVLCQVENAYLDDLHTGYDFRTHSRNS